MIFKKNKVKKENNKKSSFDQNLLLFLLAGLLFGLVFYLLSKKLFLFVLSMLCFLTFYLLTSAGKEKLTPEKSKIKEKEYNLTFVRLFYHYSSLLNSYEEGFKKAYEVLPLCHLKDKLTDYMDNPKGPLPLLLTNTLQENSLIDLLNRFLHSQEEVTSEDLGRLQRAIRLYEEEDRSKSQMSVSFLLPSVLLLVYLFALVFALFPFTLPSK